MGRLRLGVLVAVTIVGSLLAACGSDDGSDTSTGAQAADTTGGDDGDGGDTTGPSGSVENDKPTGTVTVGDETFQLRGKTQRLQGGQMVQLDGDFEHCTYRDGGTDGHVTVRVHLDEEREFFVSFTDDPIDSIARYPDLTTTTDDVEATVEAEIVSGSADFSADGGPVIEFEFDCRP